MSVEFLQVASHRLTLDQALAALTGFARGEVGTLKYCDFGGRHGPRRRMEWPYRTLAG
jgi:hypothetical protein